jgi:hypothetical protein
VLIVLPFYSGDLSLAKSLLGWINALGGCPEHNLLLAADANVQWDVVLDMIALGNKSFRNTGVITTKESVTGWPKGSNVLFKTVAQHCKDHHTAFLWLEPDCVPLRKGWIDEIQKAYNERTKPFMGRIYSATDPGVPSKMMSGIGVYPENAIDLIGNACDTDKAWDVMVADLVVPKCDNTRLIHHFWGQPNLAPTFSAVRTPQSPINTFTFEMIDPESVIFHRNKDGTLIKLLRKRLLPGSVESVGINSRKFDVVFPFCSTDADLALANMQWMYELQDSYDHPIILAVDDNSRLVSEIMNIARSVFEEAILFKYPNAPVPGHPQAANWAFRHVARYMKQRGNPWLWMEPDMIPLKTGWLNELQAEYDVCGMDCMGSVVPDLGWINGTSIYPANLADTCPNLMSIPDGHWAFDTVIHPEIVHRTYNAAHLMYHCWAQVGDTLIPYGSGQLPSFSSKKMLSQLPATAVTCHRVKDDSLIKLLRSLRQ